jgi:ComF family protein
MARTSEVPGGGFSGKRPGVFGTFRKPIPRSPAVIGRVGGVLSSLFMPALCVHCRRDRWRGTPLCLGCLGKLAASRPDAVPTARADGRERVSGGEMDPAPDLRVLFRMVAPLSTLIHGFKYRHMARHIRFLCAYLRFRPDLREWASSFDLLIPVPVHATRRRERGYNQAEKIAREASRYLGLPVADTLARVRATGTQTKLNREQRGRNLENAFACRRPEEVKGKRVLIVDDVFTTGATVGRCAELLRAAGAAEIGVLAIAKVDADENPDDFALEMEAVSGYAI